MNCRPLGRRGFAALAFLPWIVTAVGLAVAATAWLDDGSSRRVPDTATTGDTRDLRALRTDLATATAENAALRTELDRLLGRGGATTGGGAATGRASAPTMATGDPIAGTEPDGTELAARISQSLSLAAVGDEESAREGAMALLQALQQGPAAMEALQEAYLSTGDPKARLMMLPTMLFGGGEAAREFVIEQARTETDPELRKALLTHAAGFATPRNAPELKGAFLDVLESEDDPALRQAAIRGLRFARDHEVQEKLLAAARDPSEEIRVAAIESLAAQPEARRRLEEVLTHDPSHRVRELGECRLLLAEHMR